MRASMPASVSVPPAAVAEARVSPLPPDTAPVVPTPLVPGVADVSIPPALASYPLSNGPSTTAAFSMLLLLATQGQQFTFAELKTLLENAGFEGIETRQTASYYSITTGYKR